MENIVFQKGKFYTLPIVDFFDDDVNSYFIVDANGRHHAIRMFAFQKDDPKIHELRELPCMVKDMHGENIIFVQNFAEMFGNKYDPEESYQFTVSRLVSTLPDGKKYYDVFDENGVPFRLKTPGTVFLQPRQRINCRISRPSRNKLELIFEYKRPTIEGKCISPDQLLADSEIDEVSSKVLKRLFDNSALFQESREYLERNDPEWVIKALTAVPGVEKWSGFREKNYLRLLTTFSRVCLYVLEDSKFLKQFSESERENFQEWIAKIVRKAETYQNCLELIENNKDGAEIDSILKKIRNSGYIYNAQKKMALLIAIFSLRPHILEERIDTILDIIGESARNWKLPSFKKAFAGFIQYYIMSNRDKVNRLAFVEDDHTTQLLHRMVRAICYYLLMSDGRDVDVPLYKSMLFHYLSFVRSKNVLGQRALGISISDSLLEQAFNALVSSESISREVNWDMNFGQTELFAYQMSLLKSRMSTFTTRAYETDKVRFTVSNDGMTIARATSSGRERNVLPSDFLPWHNIQLFLDNPTKYPISPSSKISTWRNWWRKVELALFEERTLTERIAPRKISPDVGTEVTVRVLYQDSDMDHPNRFYCRIEDDMYQGEGWIDTYVDKGSNGIFHYNPRFTFENFCIDGKPLLFRTRVNSEGSPYNDVQRYYFDSISLMDDYIRSTIQYDEESDCRLVYHDETNHVMLGITAYGYGVFVPDSTPDFDYRLGDTVRVRVTSYQRIQTIQAEVIGPADYDVNVTEAAESLLQDFAGGEVYEESEDELAEEAMSVSEDQFDIDYINQMICLLDHKAVVEDDNTKAYGYLSVACILAGMIEDEATQRYLDQRRSLLCMLEDYGKNGKVDEAEFDKLSVRNADIVEKFPVLKQRICEVKILNSMGKQENNSYLWDLVSHYGPGHIVGKLARLMLSYNMADGFNLSEHQNSILSEIRQLKNINIEIPVIYSFGQENQTKEFKSSIVFPPENGMQPNLEEQTFNIMKVICGMVNAYGGTLYLGVYDTGTAKGLDDDLPFFDNSRDKFDLYVRNQIRFALGDAVNASIKIHHPEAGKYWIYAIQVAPSKTPVQLRTTRQYFLREGSSTYAIDDVNQLREIMDNRDFERFPVENDAIIADAEVETADDSSTDREPKERTRVFADDEEKKIPTSHLRSNITENWLEGYGVDTAAYFRIYDNNEWSKLDDVEWDEGKLTLAIHDEEKDGFMMMVYPDGRVLKVPMSKILKQSAGGRHKMLAGTDPLFVSPARKNDALLTTYIDDRGKRFFRLDDLSEIEETRITDKGNTLSDVEFAQMGECEIIPADHIEELKRMRNHRRTSLGFQLSTAYGKEEKEYLEKIGIPLK